MLPREIPWAVGNCCRSIPDYLPLEEGVIEGPGRPGHHWKKFRVRKKIRVRIEPGGRQEGESQ